MNPSHKVQNLPILETPATIYEASNVQPHFYRDYFKRLFDLALALILLPITLPILLILMILIKLDSKGPALYKSERVGKDGRKFNCLKLRTMCLHAHEKLEEVLENNTVLKFEYQKYCKLKNDPRVTRVGKILRSFSLDELPQIFNVLRGEMSFVGPRPVFEWEIPKYGKLFEDYKSVLPGITGIWQVNGRNEASFQKRVTLDSSYSKESRFSLDLTILLKTLPAIISKKGAY